ncbi:MAG TPA: hypothetical protein VM910_29850 [Bradyrhizobium sp.]|jgi:hypothetical protein|nr:hypothetical protein [Bradyrhizobium sp.]
MARREVTGKKPANGDAKKRVRSLPPAFATAFTVTEFCQAHRISETTYYELKKLGLGPDEMEIGRKRIISIEAAARWRKAREVVAAEAAE